ncbi:MAG: VWA domain-containing protein [Treponema sp.]|nr:VWA domain-containing protein [Treponema sp.]
MKLKMKTRILAGIFIAAAAFSYAENAQDDESLTVTSSDIFIERNSGRSIGTSTDGFNLYVRKKDGIESVMLTETTRDPDGKEDNFAYRSETYNSLNGDEIRVLEGKKLTSKDAQFSLISSTVGYHPRLGECFLIYIPKRIVYGYPWTRNGAITISKGTFVNIRTFNKKYGDYSGKWKDNPFMFDFTSPAVKNDAKSDTPAPEKNVTSVKTEVTTTTTTTVTETTVEENVEDEEEEIEEVVPSDEYNTTATETFGNIAKKAKGKSVISKGPTTLPEDLRKLLGQIKIKADVDVVFAIDTTGSMRDDLLSLKTRWIPSLINQAKEFGSLRVGLVFYRDFLDDYNYKGLPVKIFDFTENIDEVSEHLNSITIRGNEGGDVPEAVYEALYASLTYFEWRPNADKNIILIGDAEPHPYPKGTKKISDADVMSLANEKNVKINTIIVPNTIE